MERLPKAMLSESIKIISNLILICGALLLVAGGALIWDSRAPKALPSPSEEILAEPPSGDIPPGYIDLRDCLACHSRLTESRDEDVSPPPGHFVTSFPSELVEPEPRPAAVVVDDTPDVFPTVSDPRTVIQIKPTEPPSKRGAPQRLAIPSMDIDSKVIPVKASALEGGTDWPIPLEDISWYVGTAIPGDPGNALMAGHVITKGGGGVFRKLYRVTKGTPIYVETTGGTLTYVVAGIRVVLPTEVSVLADTNDPTLTLITCAGDFDPATAIFDRRLVVTARLEANP